MENQPLFDPSEFPPAPNSAQPGVKALPYPLWTEHKATLIFRYLRYFVYITKHGTYIDGFSGRQNEHEGMWAAKLVSESEPRRLRHFHLVEIEKSKIPDLEALKAAADAHKSGPKRTVSVYHGDFNVEIDGILSAGTIKPKEATFCLLDQRTFECHWRSLEKVARYKPVGEHKIELFYFLPIGWLDRALAAVKNETLLLNWWGRADWSVLLEKTAAQRAQLFAERIRTELGYESVIPWPIYDQQGSNRIMYFMIHATDHPEAPKLMRRAYIRAVEPLEPVEQLQLEWERGTLLAADDVPVSS